MKNENTSRELSLVEGTISYCAAGESWLVKLSEVHLIGELSTPNASHDDSHFLIFLTAKENGWHQAPFAPNGRDDFLRELGDALNTSITTSLSDCTDYRSRILWPQKLRGKPLVRIVQKTTKLGRWWATIRGNKDFVLAEASGHCSMIKQKPNN